MAYDLLIKNGTVVDGTGAAPRQHMSIRIENGKIVDIAGSSAKQSGDRQIDGSGRFLVPGFFDNNAHLTVYGQPARRDEGTRERSEPKAPGRAHLRTIDDSAPPCGREGRVEFDGDRHCDCSVWRNVCLRRYLAGAAVARRSAGSRGGSTHSV